MSDSAESRSRDTYSAKRRTFLVGVRIVGQNAATESVHDLSDDDADPAGAEDTDRLGVEFNAEQAFEGHIAFADPSVGAVDLSVQGQDQRDGMLGHGVGGVGGHADHLDSHFGSGVEIDVIEAGAAEGNQLGASLAKRVEHGGVDPVVDEDADGWVSVGQGDRLGVERRLDEGQIVAEGFVGFAEEAVPVGFITEDDDSHRGNSGLFAVCEKRNYTHRSKVAGSAVTMRRRVRGLLPRQTLRAITPSTEGASIHVLGLSIARLQSPD